MISRILANKIKLKKIFNVFVYWNNNKHLIICVVLITLIITISFVEKENAILPLCGVYNRVKFHIQTDK